MLHRAERPWSLTCSVQHCPKTFLMQRSWSVATDNIFVPADPSPGSKLIQCSFLLPGLYKGIEYVDPGRKHYLLKKKKKSSFMYFEKIE